MKEHRRAVVWFRRDLRLTDNPALLYAVEHADCILPIYIHGSKDEGPWAAGAASRWWLHHSLQALDAALASRGGGLMIRVGDTLDELRAVLAECGATLLVWNRLYEPHEIAREQQIERAFEDLEIVSRNGSLLFEPRSLRNSQEQPFRVFSAFWRAAERQLDSVAAPRKAPRQLDFARVATRRLDDLALMPQIAWYDGMAATWQPGEDGALARLKRFQAHVSDYATGRDRPDRELTSRLSPHLHFGEVSPAQVLAGIRNAGASAGGAEVFLKELGWREFAHHLLVHYPHSAEAPLDQRFERLSWVNDEAAVERWRRGRTGVPLVDAGMRQLWRTGWMHNRVRMIVASFLTKNLRTHWLEGARWFWDTLVDADLANNSLNWQWVAGSGADAAPYYRIFNPVLQAERFDPQREYIRRWLPELAKLPDRWIHQPWAAPAQIVTNAGVELGATYPQPIVDLAASRKAALAAYEDMKRSARLAVSGSRD